LMDLLLARNPGQQVLDIHPSKALSRLDLQAVKTWLEYGEDLHSNRDDAIMSAPSGSDADLVDQGGSVQALSRDWMRPEKVCQACLQELPIRLSQETTRDPSVSATKACSLCIYYCPPRVIYSCCPLPIVLFTFEESRMMAMCPTSLTFHPKHISRLLRNSGPIRFAQPYPGVGPPAVISGHKPYPDPTVS
jgi:hypothetical protein